MNRLPTVDPAAATGNTKAMLEAVKVKLGVTPNMMRTMANSPVVLESYLGFSDTLGKGELSAKLRGQIAIAVAEANECSYCLSAHTVIGEMLGLNPEELSAARRAGAVESESASALAFAQRVAIMGGAVTDEEFRRVKAAGYTDAEVAEIIANVALNTFTNIFNKACGTEIDFPRIGSATALKA